MSTCIRKGLVLGMRSGKSFCLSPVAKFINTRTCGRFLRFLKTVSGENIEEGKVYTLTNVDKCYHGMCVYGLPEMGCDDEMEMMNSNKESIRNAAALGCKKLEDLVIDEVHVESMDDAEAAAEGAFLSVYKFQDDKSKKKQIPFVRLYEEDEKMLWCWNKGKIKAKAQNWARTLMNTPSNKMTPKIFVETAKKILEPAGVTVKIHDKNWIESQNMRSFLTVSKGSKQPPYFLELTYDGSLGEMKQPFVLVGKGITFDSGGISLNRICNLEKMKGDLGGAACVVASIYALATLKMSVNVVGLVPLAENLPSGTACKPGDIIIAMNGKSICIENTGCEGRLILADALYYSKKFMPKLVLDVATLTTAMLCNLGEVATGVYANNNKFFACLQQASAVSGDRIWRMPLWKHYTNQISKYDLYDLSNTGRGLGGNSNKAAAFLREFVPYNTPWIHMDTYSVMENANIAYLSDKGMSGRPTRTIIEFLASLSLK